MSETNSDDVVILRCPIRSLPADSILWQPYEVENYCWVSCFSFLVTRSCWCWLSRWRQCFTHHGLQPLGKFPARFRAYHDATGPPTRIGYERLLGNDHDDRAAFPSILDAAEDSWLHRAITGT